MTKSEKSLNLIRNAMITPDGTLLISRGRHDYVTHVDENGKEYMLDGGLSYIRCSANGDECFMAMYDDEPHTVQRWVLKWGTYGKNGDQPLTLKPVADMDTGHIKAVLEECNPAFVYRKCMEAELKFRNKDDIYIKRDNNV